jgi:hypothetical protein
MSTTGKDCHDDDESDLGISEPEDNISDGERNAFEQC